MDPTWTDVVSALADSVGAIAAAVGVGVALIFGISQVREAARLRREQAQPQVAMYVDDNRTTWRAQDLIIENFGATGAYDVVVESNPKLQRVSIQGDNLELLALPERIPFLAPGQQWRTLWDFAWRVAEIQAKRPNEVPNVYEVRVIYKDSTGRVYSTESILDWRTVMGRRSPTKKDVQDVANALDRIGKTLGTWTDEDAVRVAQYDGRRREAVERADNRDRRRLGAHGSAALHQVRREAGLDALPAPTALGRLLGRCKMFMHRGQKYCRRSPARG